MNYARTVLPRLARRGETWLVRHSIALLRMSLGVVFLGFGLLKFFPDVSPAQALAERTMSLLTFGIVPGGAGLVAVALLECAIGVTFLTGRLLGVGVALLGVALVGILSPLVLLAGDLFTGPYHAPNLAGQYVIKDLVLAAAGLVIAATLRGGHLSRRRSRAERSARVRPAAQASA